MPGPLAIYTAVQTLRGFWRDSKRVRDWLWGKHPIVKDLKKREAIEAHIAVLLDDASKLAQALPAEALDEKITERVAQFKKDLAKEGVSGEEAEGLAERANLLVRLYVTGPLGDVVDLRFRLDDDEEALRAAEVAVASLTQRVGELEAQTSALRTHSQKLYLLVAISATAAVFSLLIALVALVAHR